MMSIFLNLREASVGRVSGRWPPVAAADWLKLCEEEQALVSGRGSIGDPKGAGSADRSGQL